MDELGQAWQRDGYVVLRGAAPTGALDAYPQELAAEREGLLVRIPGQDHVSLAAQLGAGQAAGAVDPYALSDAARALLLAPAVLELVTDAFYDGEPPLLFDAVEAAAGPPDDRRYRDATFTALAEAPETLVTVVVATGQAAVAVLPGSQTRAPPPFPGPSPHPNRERDGDAALQRHRDELAAGLADAPAAALELDRGDVVLWAAGLVHEPVTGAALIGHLSPPRVKPGWFASRPERARHAVYAEGAAWIASQHYDLVDALEPAEEPAGTEDGAELDRIEDALREHAAELAYEPGPPPPPPPAGEPSQQGRRSGGIVDSVRGLVGRRGRRGR